LPPQRQEKEREKKKEEYASQLVFLEGKGEEKKKQGPSVHGREIKRGPSVVKTRNGWETRYIPFLPVGE